MCGLRWLAIVMQMASYCESKIWIYTQSKLFFFNDILCLAAVFAEGVFVKQVFSHPAWSSHAPQVGHPVCQFFDGLHLLVQEMCLDEITQLKQNINSWERKDGISLGTRQFFPPITTRTFDTRM